MCSGRLVATLIKKWQSGRPLDAVELLDERPEGSSRFYWNEMDLCLKMLTDASHDSRLRAARHKSQNSKGDAQHMKKHKALAFNRACVSLL